MTLGRLATRASFLPEAGFGASSWPWTLLGVGVASGKDELFELGPVRGVRMYCFQNSRRSRNSASLGVIPAALIPPEAEESWSGTLTLPRFMRTSSSTMLSPLWSEKNGMPSEVMPATTLGSSRLMRPKAEEKRSWLSDLRVPPRADELSDVPWGMVGES